VTVTDYRSVVVDGPDDAGVVTVTLNRPHAANALDEAMHDELIDVARRLRSPRDARAVVLTGAGRCFCAGGDLAFIRRLATDDDHRVRTLELGVHLVHDWLSIRPPVVTALNGHAIGFGATLGLLGDIVYMADNALIADPHVRAGVVAGDGGALLWPILMGPSRAKEYLMTGDSLDAHGAYELGLVNHVEPAAEVVEAATTMARRLAAGPLHAIAWTKQAVNAQLLRQAATVLPLSLALEGRTMAQHDVREGTAALAERRAPVWPSATAMNDGS
jgi:enoyl-CoA hydratase